MSFSSTTKSAEGEPKVRQSLPRYRSADFLQPYTYRRYDLRLTGNVVLRTSPTSPGVRVVVEEATLQQDGERVIIKQFRGENDRTAFERELQGLQNIWDHRILQLRGWSSPEESFPFLVCYSPTPSLRSSTTLQDFWDTVLRSRNLDQVEDLTKQLRGIVFLLWDYVLERDRQHQQRRREQNRQRRQQGRLRGEYPEITDGNLMQDLVMVLSEDRSQYTLFFVGDINISPPLVKQLLDRMGLEWFMGIERMLRGMRTVEEHALSIGKRKLETPSASLDSAGFLSNVCRRERKLEVTLQSQSQSGSPLARWLQDSREERIRELPMPLSRVRNLLEEVNDLYFTSRDRDSF